MVVFETVRRADGGYCAGCLAGTIFTEGATCDELRGTVGESAEAFFSGRPRPGRIRLHLVRGQVLSVA